MMWLFGQVFVLCLVSFVAGSAMTAVVFVMQRRFAPAPAVEPTGERRIVEMEEE
ncbi:hypothetical protein [Kutzneria kofuensis]|uniref:Uncharacterized protein n=1 Tax=Kutzneria kofuensis TaxID=103725 RepID=A0A7W9KKF9_9PSEU|nr:hypothetical protein [Kutzneria kofuensis]MBB5894196.1 hypothetical protein [Kutzneria kofuensis]